MRFKNFEHYILTGREIEFKYNDIPYFISKSEKGNYIYNDVTKEIYYFESERELIKNAKINSLTLIECWKDITIDYIL